MKCAISVLTIAASLLLTTMASAAEPGAWPWQLGEFPWQTGGIVHVPPVTHP